MLYEHSNANFEKLYKLIKREKFEWITSAPSVMVDFSEYLIRNSIVISHIKYIECHSEFLFFMAKK